MNVSAGGGAGGSSATSGFRIEAVKTRYSISGSAKGKQEAAEVLVSNFKLA